MQRSTQTLANQIDRCCINTATLGYREPIEVSANRIAAQGFQWITPWRQEVNEKNPERAASAIRAAGLKVSSYCRTTYFTGNTVQERQHAVDDNRRAIEAAAVLGASDYVAVVGGLATLSTDIAGDRERIKEGLAALIPTLQATGVRIALEPLHPFYAANRSLLNTLDQARKWCEELDPEGALFGLAVDAYHVWWDPDLDEVIDRAANRIRAFHVCDWLRDTQEPLLDRGMMGDGVIDLRGLRDLVESKGYRGLIEVEIFSKDNWWKRPPDEVLRICRERLVNHC